MHLKIISSMTLSAPTIAAEVSLERVSRRSTEDGRQKEHALVREMVISSVSGGVICERVSSLEPMSVLEPVTLRFLERSGTEVNARPR